MNINLYCLSFKYYNLVDKLPAFIKPLGLGSENYPSEWLIEKKGQNISHLNKYYGQFTGIFWIWKNQLENFKDDDWIGTCEYRKFWLNNLYLKKQKYSIKSLYSNLLKTNNLIFKKCEAVLVQPIKFKIETINQQFNKTHNIDILKDCINLIDSENQKKFITFLKNNKLSTPPLFITKVKFFKKFCEEIFPLLDRSFKYFNENSLCFGKNLRLPAFFTERYASFWFEENCKTEYLSHARIGKLMLSNRLNKYINPAKIPFTLRMYPTIHDY